MKCIRCSQDCKYKERQNGFCTHCNGRFAFEPKTGDPLSDAQFEGCIARVSSEGKVKWTPDHLYYEVCRTLARKPAAQFASGCGVVSLALGAITLPSLPHDPILPPVFLALGIGMLVAGRKPPTPPMVVPMTYAAFTQLWKRWQDTHLPSASLIVRPPKPDSPPPLEADVADYSFDRAVICDRARTVDVLLANNFHFENNCAILSYDGYPETAFETVRQMLKRNPHLQVFVLHDATAEGCSLAGKIATDPEWFNGQVRVVDVGLRPRHVTRFKGLMTPRTSVAAPVVAGLTPEEVQWLGLYSVGLAALRPEQLIKRLYRAMNAPDPVPGQDKDGIDVDLDDTSMATDADASDGGVDSFG